jgi:hypothetical protein
VIPQDHNLGHWTYLGDSIPDGSVAFTYLIREKTTNHFYVGVKNMLKKVTRPPLKGTKRKRVSYEESDWKTYCSSSGAWKTIIENNKDNYIFQILNFHPSIKLAKIQETKLILENIFKKECMNQVLSIRTTISQKEKS